MASPQDELTSITHLPDDSLIFIFHRLDCSTDRDSFGLTCRHWLHIQNISRRSLQFDCSFSLKFDSTHKSLSVDSFHLDRLLDRFRHLQHLCLCGCMELPDSGLTRLQYFGSDLRSLNLDCCFGVTDDGLSLVAAGCPSLSVISLCRCKITDTGLEILASRCSGLKNVNLENCSLITDYGLSALSQGCRQLQAVKIANCTSISGVGFRGCSHTLALVDAEGCALEPEGIRAILSGGGIEYFNVSCARWSLSPDGLVPVGAGFACGLKILNLRLCRTIGDLSVIAIAKGCPLLEEWSLAVCHEVKLPGWGSIAFHCNNLKILHVNRCRNLCSNSLQALSYGCKRLMILYMSRSTQLSALAIELFRMHRSEVKIKEEEIPFIGPNWTLE